MAKYQYIIFDREKLTKVGYSIKETPISIHLSGGYFIYPPEAVIGIIVAPSPKQADSLAKSKGLDGKITLYNSKAIGDDVRQAADKIGIVAGSIEHRKAGRKSSGDKVVSIQLRLSESLIQHLDRQPKKAAYIKKLIDSDYQTGNNNNRDR